MSGRLTGGMGRPILLPMLVWDIWTRLFHWLVVVLVTVSYVSIQFGAGAVHILSGETLLSLLVFRLIWGFVGSDTARFGRFLRDPAAGLRHFGALGRREPDTEIGHNAAGGWWVIVMLLLLAAQVGTGLFSHVRKGDFGGPLSAYIDRDTAVAIGGWHGLIVNLLLGAIAVHVAVIGVYGWAKGQNLLRPMLTGKKRLPGATRAPRMASPVLALIVLGFAAAVAYEVATF